MSENQYESNLSKAIENVTEEIAKGIKAARAKGVICGPATDIKLLTEECIGGDAEASLESLTLSSVDSAPAPKASPWWKRLFERRS
jgi:hypothetical protein